MEECILFKLKIRTSIDLAFVSNKIAQTNFQCENS